MTYVSSTTRATNALVTVVHRDGSRQVRVDQTSRTNSFVLGTFPMLTSGALVIISNEGANGKVID
jgi:hypothetical protein